MQQLAALLVLIPMAAAGLAFTAGMVVVTRLALSQWPVLTWPERGRLAAKIVGIALFVAAFLQFTVYLVLVAACGGSAEDGKVESGRHYVASHGRYTEVSPGMWHVLSVQERLAHRLGVIGTVGLGVCVLLAFYDERKARHRGPQPLSVTALLQPGDKSGSRDAADRQAALRPAAGQFSIGTAIAALLLMLVLDAAALQLLLTDVMHLFGFLFVLWLVAAPCWLVMMFFSDKESPLLTALAAVAFVGATAFIGGPVVVFGCGAIGMLRQDLVVAILVLIPVSLLALGFQFLFAMIAAASIMAIFTDPTKGRPTK